MCLGLSYSLSLSTLSRAHLRECSSESGGRHNPHRSSSFLRTGDHSCTIKSGCLTVSILILYAFGLTHRSYASLAAISEATPNGYVTVGRIFVRLCQKQLIIVAIAQDGVLTACPPATFWGNNLPHRELVLGDSLPGRPNQLIDESAAGLMFLTVAVRENERMPLDKPENEVRHSIIRISIALGTRILAVYEHLDLASRATEARALQPSQSRTGLISSVNSWASCKLLW
nr:hypothetical protein Iba_chr14eCG5170 [Ipomoea batatas]